MPVAGTDRQLLEELRRIDELEAKKTGATPEAEGTGILGQAKWATKEYARLGVGSAMAFNRAMSMWAGNYDKIWRMLEEKTGVPYWDIYDKAHKQFARHADILERKFKDPTLTEEIVTEFVGGSIPGIAEFVQNVPYAAGVGYAEEGLEGAIKESVKRFLMGRMLKMAGILRRPKRVAAMGAVGGVTAAAEGGGPREITKGVGVMGLLGMMGGPGPPKRPRLPRRPIREPVRQPVERPPTLEEEVQTLAETPESEFVRGKFAERFLEKEEPAILREKVEEKVPEPVPVEEIMTPAERKIAEVEAKAEGLPQPKRVRRGPSPTVPKEPTIPTEKPPALPEAAKVEKGGERYLQRFGKRIADVVPIAKVRGAISAKVFVQETIAPGKAKTYVVSLIEFDKNG